MPPITLTPLGTPVVSARNWAEGLVPRNGGGWMWMIQLYNYPDHNPTEWVVMHVEDGLYHIDVDTDWTPNDRGRYVSSSNLHTIKHQQRAPNGRLFWPAISCWWWYYDPADEIVHDMGQFNTGGPNDGFYSVAFNHDGSKLYSGTIAAGNSPNHLPSAVEFDVLATPPTGRDLGRVGSLNHTLNAYAYYLWADSTPSATAPQGWLYVLVGQDVWDCVAVNIATKAQTIIATVGTGSWAFFKEIVGQGLTVQMISNYGLPNQSINQFWVYDGANVGAYSVGVPPPFTPYDVSKYTNSIDPLDPPQIDSTPSPEAMLWRPFGSTGAWTENDYAINYAAPVDINVLYTLPSDQILGATDQYLGWFRYDKPSGMTTFYGAWNGVAEIQFCPTAINSKIYFTGYPNGVLWEYNPNTAWNVVTGTPNQNPKKLGNYSNGITFSGVKRGRRLGYSSTYNRLFMVGQRDRSGDGGGIGYYDFGTKAFAGTFANLTGYTDKMGLAVFDNLDRYILAGEVTTGTAQLVLYDHNLTEIERQTPYVGSTDTGQLFRTNEAQVVVGLSSVDKRIYRWNIVSKTLLAEVSLASYGTIGVCTQRADGTLDVVAGSHLLNVNLVTLVVTDTGTLSDPALATLATTTTGDIYTSIGPDLYVITNSAPTIVDLSGQAFGVLSPINNASFSTGTSGTLSGGKFSVDSTIRDADLTAVGEMFGSAVAVTITIRPAALTHTPAPQRIIDLPAFHISLTQPLLHIDLPPPTLIVQNPSSQEAEIVIDSDPIDVQGDTVIVEIRRLQRGIIEDVAPPTVIPAQASQEAEVVIDPDPIPAADQELPPVEVRRLRRGVIRNH